MPNPIERRLQALAAEWNAFASNPDLRLLIWSVKDDEARTVDLFFQANQRGSLTGVADVTIRLTSPFESAKSYGRTLIDEFEQIWASSREDLAQSGIDPNWQRPTVRPDGGSGTDARLFIEYFAAFRQCYQTQFERLGIALLPDSARSAGEWSHWLEDYLANEPPELLRLTVLDAAGEPQLASLAQAYPNAVSHAAPNVDFQAAVREIAAQSQGRGPGFEFRRLFIDLTGLVAKDDPKYLKLKSDGALKIAGEQRWHDQEVVVHMLVGAAHLKAARPDEALVAYLAAQAAADSAAQAAHPAAAKLAIHALFGEAGVYVSAARYAEAAPVYEKIAVKAGAAGEQLFELEGWRMAGFCHEQAQQFDEAWRCGEAALAVGESMDAATRNNTTLPFVAQGLLRVRQQRRDDRANNGEHLEPRLERTFGADWRAQIAAAGAPAP